MQSSSSNSINSEIFISFYPPNPTLLLWSILPFIHILQKNWINSGFFSVINIYSYNYSTPQLYQIFSPPSPSKFKLNWFHSFIYTSKCQYPAGFYCYRVTSLFLQFNISRTHNAIQSNPSPTIAFYDLQIHVSEWNYLSKLFYNEIETFLLNNPIIKMSLG